MAGKTSSDDDGGLIADINVTPLVDITLVLLIIFMVAAPMIMKQAIKVNLPKAATGKTAPDTSVAVTIKMDGRVFFMISKGKAETVRFTVTKAGSVLYAVKKANDRDFSNDAGSDMGYLTSYLKEEARVNKKIRAILSADKDVLHGKVVSYMDLLNRVGISRYAVSVEKPSKGPKQ
ncbi:MAG: biopolymer transporter ExbD [bacterium]